jgi:hypothetical protein
MAVLVRLSISTMKEKNQLTFEADDKLDLKSFSEKLEKFLLVEHDFVEGSLVISLNGQFGAGKTTFLSMWKSDLQERQIANLTLPKTVVINAWESDYCGDPLLSIVDGLIEVTRENPSESESNAPSRLRNAAKDLGWFATGLANQMASHWAGIDPLSAGKLAEEKQKSRQPKVPDFVSLYQARTKSLKELKKTLSDIFGGDVPKVFIFVDELDRCRPDYAISYLETIKHVFDVHGLVFVLAVDYDQLECSAKALFGSDLKFSDYFRKFAQRTVSLPEPSESGLNCLAEHYVRYYLEIEGKRSSLMHFDSFRVKNIVDLIRSLRMPPRQIQESFRILGHTVAGDSSRGKLYWCIGVGTILMSVLKVARPSLYRQVGRGEVSDLEVGEFLVKTVGKEEAKWWFSVYVTGVGNREAERSPINAADLFNRLKFTTDAKEIALADFSQGWGRSWVDRWKEIYNKIETTTAF